MESPSFLFLGRGERRRQGRRWSGKAVDLCGGDCLLCGFSEATDSEMSEQKKKDELGQTAENPQGVDPESELPPDADVEEKFNDFWKKNGPGIFGGIALGAILVLGVQVYQYAGVKKEESIRAEFAQAESVVDLAGFAEEYPKHPLGGLALLSVADERFEEESFGEAADLYGEAAEVLTDTPMQARALVGQGVSLIRSGAEAAGQDVLETVALDGAVLDQTRGEAAYHLAVSQWEAGEPEAARDTLDIILQLDEASMWSFRAEDLRDRLELPEVATASSSDSAGSEE